MQLNPLPTNGRRVRVYNHLPACSSPCTKFSRSTTFVEYIAWRGDCGALRVVDVAVVVVYMLRVLKLVYQAHSPGGSFTEKCRIVLNYKRKKMHQSIQLLTRSVAEKVAKPESEPFSVHVGIDTF